MTPVPVECRAPAPAPVEIAKPAPREEAKTGDPKPLGLVSIMSTPSGATVELDGGYVGKTPIVLHHRFDKDSYRLNISTKGFKPWIRDVRVDKQKGTLNVVATLEPQ